MHPLLALAKASIETAFSNTIPTMPEGFTDKQGCFVTLTKHDELRGCIGYITTDKPLKETIVDAARGAAFHDPRFPPITKEEFEECAIEVSILSRPTLVKEKDQLSRQQAFIPGTTGLIIQQGWRSGLLLPQVFDEETTAQEALEMTCRKAGLKKDAWKSTHTELYTFTVERIEE